MSLLLEILLVSSDEPSMHACRYAPLLRAWAARLQASPPPDMPSAVRMATQLDADLAPLCDESAVMKRLTEVKCMQNRLAFACMLVLELVHGEPVRQVYISATVPRCLALHCHDS